MAKLIFLYIRWREKYFFIKFRKKYFYFKFLLYICTRFRIEAI
jgi:hypothetical protein